MPNVETPLSPDQPDPFKLLTQALEDQNKPMFKENISISLALLMLKLIKDALFQLTNPALSDSSVDASPILTFLKQFNDLMVENLHFNLSNDASFAQKLSNCWEGLLHAQHLLSKKDRSTLAYQKLEKFIAFMMQFPAKGTQSFGYYLSNYAGKDWFPFPFIQILLNLHEDYVLKGEESKGWLLTKLMQNLIDNFCDSKKV